LGTIFRITDDHLKTLFYILKIPTFTMLSDRRSRRTLSSPVLLFRPRLLEDGTVLDNVASGVVTGEVDDGAGLVVVEPLDVKKRETAFHLEQTGGFLRRRGLL
jgi:hypothetical protein